MRTRSAAEIARDTRWKVPSMQTLGYYEMWSELQKMRETLDDIHWFAEQGDETFLNAMEGDDDEENAFRIAFSELESHAEFVNEMFGKYESKARFIHLMRQKEADDFDDADTAQYTTCRKFDDCTVALLGERYNYGMMGYDAFQEDFYALDENDKKYATDAAKKRLMRLGKKDMLDLMGQSLSIVLAFNDFRVSYTLLVHTFEQIRGENLETLNAMREINRIYDEVDKAIRYKREHDFYEQGDKLLIARFDGLLENLPDRFWVE